MERLTLRLYSSMHQKDIYQLSILNDMFHEVALCGNGVLLGPYFIRESINGQACLNMLNEFVFPLLPVNFGDVFGGLKTGLQRIA